MTEISNILWEVREGSAVYDLEKRTYQFALAVRKFTKTLPQTISNREDVKQLIRASGSVGANYIEANEALSKKDFLMRIRISRKDAKESIYWLRLLRDNNNLEYDNEVNRLIREATELKKIFSTIIEKSK